MKLSDQATILKAIPEFLKEVGRVDPQEKDTGGIGIVGRLATVFMAAAIILTSIVTIGDEIYYIYQRSIDILSNKESIIEESPTSFSEKTNTTIDRLLDDHLQCQIALHEKELEVADLRANLRSCRSSPTMSSEENVEWQDRLKDLE